MLNDEDITDDDDFTDLDEDNGEDGELTLDDGPADGGIWDDPEQAGRDEDEPTPGIE